MYIWVLLATFITIIYSFNLSVREDVRNLKVAPVAEALVSKSIIQHKAAKDYYRVNEASIQSSTNSKLILDGDDLVNYAPFGLNLGGVSTEIYCLKDDANLNSAIACNNAGAKRFLISYNVVPQRWINLSSGMPNNDYTAAIRNLMGREPTFGITVAHQGGTVADGTYESDLEIKNNDKVRVFVPEYIINSTSFSDVCGTSHCLVFLSSMN